MSVLVVIPAGKVGDCEWNDSNKVFDSWNHVPKWDKFRASFAIDLDTARIIKNRYTCVFNREEVSK